ncbi:MAG: SDR family oxidoreductase [Deltaproteobacteria bacterium]|nr:MAG: SDR family oxidoreductase [Deltaproteobacteria bacterium]
MPLIAFRKEGGAEGRSAFLPEFRQERGAEVDFASGFLRGKTVLLINGGWGGAFLLSTLNRYGARVSMIERPEKISGTLLELERIGLSQDDFVLEIPGTGERFQLAEEIEAVIEACGTIDILIQNLLPFPPSRPAERLDRLEWEGVISEKLHQTFQVDLLLARHFMAHGGGRIIHVVSSIPRAGLPFQAAAAAATAAVENLTRSLAYEWGRTGLRVNTLAYGHIDTPQAREHFWATPQQRERIEETIPLGHLASQDDVIGPLLFLCSDASAYLTGTTVTVDGGVGLKQIDLG